MDLINLKDLNLSTKESRDIIDFIAQKRGISTKELLSTIKPKPENNQILTPKKPPKLTKLENNQILTPEKPLKNLKRKNNRILTSENKERIGIIREEELKELVHKLSKSELKEIKDIRLV